MTIGLFRVYVLALQAGQTAKEVRMQQVYTIFGGCQVH